MFIFYFFFHFLTQGKLLLLYIVLIILQILWSPLREENDELNLSLVSADSAGFLVYWNVKDAKIISSVQEGNKPVAGNINL